MKISVIIPCFNNENLLSETIESVLAQTHSELECILVDDGSSDDSREVAKDYILKDARILFQERPKGLPKGANSCRNHGATLATGELLLFLDADDLLASNCLEERLNCYQDQDLLIGQAAVFEGNIEGATSFFENLSTSKTREHYLGMFLEYLIPWHTSSGLWKKSFFEKIGGFNSTLQRFQDVELHVRALAESDIRFKIDFAAGFTSFYRKSAFHQSMSPAKRRFVLDQGTTYLSELKRTLPSKVLSNLQGTMVYLLFRFEEVIGSEDVDILTEFSSKDSVQNGQEVNSWEASGIISLFRKLPSPSRIRKYLSFALYKLYRRRVMKTYS